MKIAQVVCVFPPYGGGIGNVAHEFSRILADKNHTVTVFTLVYQDNIFTSYNKFSIVKLSPILRYGKGGFAPQLIKYLKDFEIVHLHYPFFGMAELVWFAKVILKYKFKLMVHYHMDTEKLPITAMILSLPSRLILPSLIKNAAAVTCASIDYIANSVIKNIYLKNKNKFYEINFGVDSSFFYPVKKNIADLKLFKLLFVGSLDRAHYFKGVDILISAIKQLKTKNCLLTIVGDGDLRTKYEDYAVKLDIKNKINFAGAVGQEQLRKFYQDADLFILPSINNHEALGLVLLEAMACGIPVIASDLPGVRGVFVNGEQGLLARPGDINDLSNKIDKILSDNKKRELMGAAGRRLVEKKYTWEKTSDKLEDLIKALANNTKK